MTTLNRQMLVKGILSVVLSLFAALFAVLSFRILARSLSSEYYGTWVLLNSMVSWYLIFDFGIVQYLQNYLIKNLSQNKLDSCNAAVLVSIRILCILSIVIFFGGVFLFLLILNVSSINLTEKACAIFFFFVGALLNIIRISSPIFRTFHRNEMVVLQGLLKSSIPYIIFTLFLNISFGKLLLLSSILFLAIDSIFFLISFKLSRFSVRIDSLFLNKNKKYLRIIKVQSIKLFSYQIGVTLIETVPLFLLSTILDERYVAKFYPNFRIYLFAMIIFNSFLMSQVSYKTYAYYKKDTMKNYAILSLTYIILSPVMYFFMSNRVVVFLVGNAFAFNQKTIILMSLLMLFSLASSLVTHTYIYKGLQRKLAKVYAISCAIFLISSFILTKRFYIDGMVISIIIFQLTYLIFASSDLLKGRL